MKSALSNVVSLDGWKVRQVAELGQVGQERGGKDDGGESGYLRRTIRACVNRKMGMILRFDNGQLALANVGASARLTFYADVF